MVTAVTDARSNPNDQIAHAATVLGRSGNRMRVFKAIFTGKKKAKLVAELMAVTGFDRKQVLKEGKTLADNHIVSQIKLGNETAYQKDAFYSQHRDRVIRLANDPKKLARLPTKTSPRVALVGATQIVLPRDLFRVTVDDIDSFQRVKGTRIRNYKPRPLDELTFKKGLQRILREEGSFRDWGGEKNDLWTTRMTLRGKRHAAAFAFKGRGTTGKLTPKKMGKNGDQLQRLFQAPAVVFVVQYWREVDQSVVELTRALAVAKSVTDGREILYCVIDGQDSQRLMKAYPNSFSDRSLK